MSVVLREAEVKSKQLFSEAVGIILDLGMVDIALSVFNDDHVMFNNNPSNPLMQLKLYTVTKEYMWQINAYNVSVLHVNEVAFLVMHECLHYMLDHFKLIEGLRNDVCRNIAADIIVNDIIHDVITDETFFNPFKYKYYLGKTTIGCNSIGMSFKGVYDKVMILEEKPIIETAAINPPTINDPVVAQEMGGLTDNIFAHGEGGGGKGDEEDEDSQDGKDGSDDDSDTGERLTRGRKASKQHIDDGSLQKVLVKAHRAKIKFNALFKKLFGRSSARGAYDDIENTWLKRQRSMLSVPQSKGILPGFMVTNSKKYIIALFIDVSGSVTDEQIQAFSNLFNLIPKDKFTVIPYSFNTIIRAIPVDNRNRIEKIKTGGGTNFNAVIDFIESSDPPIDNALIITDGEDTLSKLVGKQKKYTWVVDTSENRFKESRASLPGNVFRFSDIAKEIKECH